MINFEVADGTGSSTATTYISIEDANTVLESQGASDDWSLSSDSRRQQALNTAAAYINNVYGLKFTGYVTFQTQAMEYPRTCSTVQGRGTLPTDAIPEAVRKATAILAERSLLGNLYALDETGQDPQDSMPLKSISESVSSLNEAKTYAIKDVQISTSELTKHQDVYQLLKPYMNAQHLLLRG